MARAANTGRGLVEWFSDRGPNGAFWFDSNWPHQIESHLQTMDPNVKRSMIELKRRKRSLIMTIFTDTFNLHYCKDLQEQLEQSTDTILPIWFLILLFFHVIDATILKDASLKGHCPQSRGRCWNNLRSRGIFITVFWRRIVSSWLSCGIYLNCCYWDWFIWWFCIIFLWLLLFLGGSYTTRSRPLSKFATLRFSAQEEAM